MARYNGPVCRQCRREGMKLFLKGDRCYSPKCSVGLRPTPPGEHGQARQKKQSEYGMQLREKQKARRVYGVLEAQFHGYFVKAEQKRGITGENLLVTLERHLDNVVYRLGFGSSRALRVRLIGPKGVLDNVAVLGPVRGATQAEISATDARHLGVCAPVNLSGDLSGAATVFLQAGDALLKRACAIIARRHVHMTPDEADAFGVMDGEEVSLAVAGSRPVILTGVVARVSPQSALALHIDTDEANAAGAWESTVCRMVRVPRDAFARSTSAGGAPSGSMVRDGAPIVNLSIGSTSGQTGAATVGTPAGPGRTAPGTVSPATEHTAAAPRGEITLEGKLICESAVLALPKGGVTTLRLVKGQLITPLAADALRARGITLRREERA